MSSGDSDPKLSSVTNASMSASNGSECSCSTAAAAAAESGAVVSAITSRNDRMSQQNTIISDAQAQYAEALEKRGSSASSSSSNSSSSDTASLCAQAEQQQSETPLVAAIDNSTTATTTTTTTTTATITAASAAIFTLHTVERQLIMHYCDRTSSLLFARTCKQIHVDAQHPFPHKYQSHLSIQCSNAAAVDGCIRSSLLRHFPTFEAIVSDESSLSRGGTFDRLLSSSFIHAVKVKSLPLGRSDVRSAFIDVLRQNETAANNIHSLAIDPTNGTPAHMCEVISDVVTCLPALRRCTIGRNTTIADNTERIRANEVLTALLACAPRLTHVGIKGLNVQQWCEFDRTCLSALETSPIEHLSLAPIHPTLLIAVTHSPQLTARLRSLDLSLTPAIAAATIDDSDALNNIRSFVQLTSLSFAVRNGRHLLHSHPFHHFLLALFPLLPALTSFRLHLADLLIDEAAVADVRDVLLQLPHTVNLKHFSLGFGNAGQLINEGSLFRFLTPLLAQLTHIPALVHTLHTVQLCLTGELRMRLTIVQLRSSLAALVRSVSPALPPFVQHVQLLFEDGVAGDQLSTVLATPQYAETAKHIRVATQSDDFWSHSN